jgi:hypothetical protein
MKAKYKFASDIQKICFRYSKMDDRSTTAATGVDMQCHHVHLKEILLLPCKGQTNLISTCQWAMLTSMTVEAM